MEVTPMPYPDQNSPDHESPDHETVLDPEDAAATQRYLDLVRDVHSEWDELEAAGDSSVQLSARALSTIKASVRADARHGAHVEMPPTTAGPFTVSELTLRTVVRRAVDAVPDARSLRTVVTFDDATASGRARGLPLGLTCRISARIGTTDLMALADEVRASVRLDVQLHLGLPDLPIDVHIEDLHEH
jgi:hypothetical protein